MKSRIAQKWVLPHRKVAAGSEQDITKNLPAFERAYAEFKRAVEDGSSRGLSGNHAVVRGWANGPWVQLMDRGYEIAEGILGSRAVPKGQAKGMEMAHRLYARSRKMPQDVYKWWKTNEKRLLLTIDAAKKWPVKEEGSDDLFRVGPFLVHNGLGISGPPLDAFKKALETAVKKVKTLRGIPHFQKVLYGDVFLVGQIAKAHSAAWYDINEDAIYCRLAKAKWGYDEAYALVHELAHRYWRKFMSASAKAKWESHHLKVRYTKVDLPMPQVGDTLPVRVKGAPRGWRPKVESIQRGSYFYRTHDGILGFIPENRIRRVVDQNKGMALRFPTAYSSTNEEEHFCEAVALDAFGKLSEKHQEALDSIFKERAVAAAVSGLSGIHRYGDFVGETVMSRLLTAADRSALIRLASDLPKGSEERRAILAGLKSAGEVDLHKGAELVALKDVSVGFPAGAGRGHIGVVRKGSRVRVDYATYRGDVFARLVRGEVLMLEHDDKTLTPVPDIPFAFSEGHTSHHPRHLGVVDDRVWKVVKGR